MKRFLCMALAVLMLAGVAALAEAPTPTQENGVITADEWAALYPDVVASYHMNDENTYRVSYLEEDPFLVNIYEGYGFAKDYTSAIGHTYTLQDVAKTERPHPLANCITCKTPDFTKLVNDLGESVYSMPFDEVYAQMRQSISCYNCHANEADVPQVTHSYVIKAIGGEVLDGIKPAVAVCGQCHIEYYFNSETKATSMPYSTVEGMTAEAILAYYDSMGFYDWEQPSTGTKLLKTQHPEFETYLSAGSIHNMMGLTCADCHMPKEKNADGQIYASHCLQSPLQNESLLAYCAACHKDTDMKDKVAAIQSEITAREKEVGEKLSAFKTRLADAVASGAYTEEQLDALRAAHRSAQWYWDYCYVENSEGAHNATVSRNCLNTAEKILTEAEALFQI